MQYQMDDIMKTCISVSYLIVSTHKTRSGTPERIESLWRKEERRRGLRIVQHITYYIALYQC